jgi:hypothetical protein
VLFNRTEAPTPEDYLNHLLLDVETGQDRLHFPLLCLIQLPQSIIQRGIFTSLHLRLDSDVRPGLPRHRVSIA